MTIALAFGYLMYSDRPVPGWVKEPIGISWSEINF